MKLPALLSLALGSVSLWAADRAPLGFSGPEVVKLNWNTRALRSADLDGDGLNDLLVLNNNKAAIELLYQRAPGKKAPRRPALNNSRWEPVLEDARFDRETLTIGESLYDLTTGDFDHDGRIDIAYTGDPDALVIRYQRDKEWEESVLPTAPDPLTYSGCLVAADLNGDGLTDLVQLGQKEIGLFEQTKRDGLHLITKLPLSDEGVYGLSVEDFDGNGLPDILYCVGNSRDGLRLRRQTADGFGPEESFRMRMPRSQPFLVESKDKSASKMFASVLSSSGQVEFSKLDVAHQHSNEDALPAPLVFSPRTTVKSPALHVLTDINGDKRSDIVVVDPDGARFFVYQRNKDGRFTTPTSYPSLAEIRSAAAIRWEKKGDCSLILASSRENMIAEQVFDRSDKTFSPPKALPIEGRPVAVASGFLDNGKTPLLITLTEVERNLWLNVWTKEGANLKKLASAQLSGLRSDPKDISLWDIDQDGQPEIALSVPREGLRFYHIDGDKLTNCDQLPAYRPGLLTKIDASALTTGDVDGDGRDELIVCSDNFARALRMTKTGAFETVAQFNAPDVNAEVVGAFFLPGKGREKSSIILYDRKGEQLYLLRQNEAGSSYDWVSSRPVAQFDPMGFVINFSEGASRELFLWGRDRFWWLPLSGNNIELTDGQVYASDLPDVNYNYVITGDFTGDKQDELLTVDTKMSMLEILGKDTPDGSWQSLLHFQVFEIDQHFNGQRGSQPEPHEALIKDVTGDGKNDLVLLVHDRVLVYPQE